MKTKFQFVFSVLFYSNLLLIELFLFSPPALAQTQTNQPATTTQSSGSTVVYQGVEASIQRLLCTPGISSNYAPDNESATAGPNTVLFGQSDSNSVSNVNARDISVCINRLYRFGAVLGSIAGVFFIALAGYMYILGGEQGK